MKKRFASWFTVLIILLSAGCGNSGPGSLTIEKVMRLSEKGEELTWSDFEPYEGTDVGSGIIVLHYPIDQDYYLLVGGLSYEENPAYIRLVREDNNDEYIDIRTDDVKQFCEAA